MPSEREYPTSGWRRAYETRLRPAWFGIAIMEELWECEDGRRQWRKFHGTMDLGAMTSEGKAR